MAGRGTTLQAPPSLDDPQRPLDHLALVGERGAPALIDEAGTMSHAALEREVGEVAGGLAAALRPGDRVASWSGKTRDACLLPLACARAGLVHVPVNPVLRRGQVAHILADSGAALLIANDERLGALGGERPADCRAVTDAPRGPALGSSGWRPETLAALLYTSGSTGRPKGVMLSHANLWLGAVMVARLLGLAADDRVLAALPLSFDYGQNQLLSAWAAGAAGVPVDYLAAPELVRAIGRYGVTTVAGVPPLWGQLARCEWPEATIAGVRRLTSTGGRLPVALVRRLRGVFPQASLHSMYGLTEAFRATALDPALIDAYPDSIGTAVPLAEIMVVGADGRPADEGELVQAGPLVAHGYWRDPERTAARFRPAPSWSEMGGTAVWSGDRVRRDAGGLLRFVGRDDETIKTMGYRVSPTELEEAAIASGATDEAVAVGVPDENAGEAIVLVARGDGSADAVLATYLRRELPGHMRPARVIWRTALPRNPNGKLDRAAIRAEYRG